MKLGIDGVTKPNLIERAEELFRKYPEYMLDISEVQKKCPVMILRYRSILNGMGNAIIFDNRKQFDKMSTAYISIYTEIKKLGLYHDE